jgi:hypothetical protein
MSCDFSAGYQLANSMEHCRLLYICLTIRRKIAAITDITGLRVGFSCPFRGSALTTGAILMDLTNWKITVYKIMAA